MDGLRAVMLYKEPQADLFDLEDVKGDGGGHTGGESAFVAVSRLQSAIAHGRQSV